MMSAMVRILSGSPLSASSGKADDGATFNQTESRNVRPDQP